jgi:hypothetical protein
MTSRRVVFAFGEASPPLAGRLEKGKGNVAYLCHASNNIIWIIHDGMATKSHTYTEGSNASKIVLPSLATS